MKFRVVIHGEHFRLHLIKKRWFRREEISSSLVGFYATRFVEASNANEARDRVLETVRAELEEDGRMTENSILELEQIREDEVAFNLYAPGGGYSFYAEDGSMLR